MPGDITGSMVIDSRGRRADLPRGPGVHQPAAGRRDQPDAAQDAVGAARGDGGGPGLRRRRVAHALPSPFLVAATQNPVEYEGTYPLPEAQLDRFLLKVVLPVPEREAGARDPAPARRGLRPPRRRRGRGAGGGRPGGHRGRPGRASRRVQVSPEVAGYVVDIARATRESPSLALGCQPARRHRAAAGRPGLGLADRARLRDARRRQGARPRDPGAPARPAARGRARGRRRGRRCWPPRWARSRSPADTWPSPAASRSCCSPGCVPVVLRPAMGTVWMWLLLVALVTARRLAARAPSLGPRGDAPPPGHGADRDARHVPAHRGGRGAAGGRCAAWSATRGSPAPGPPATGTALLLRPGARTVLTTAAAARAAAATCAPLGVTVRLSGPLGLACRQATLDVPGTVRSLPPFDSRKHLPSRLARLRELDGRAAVRVRGQGTEFDSLREYVRGDDVRSIDWRASARNRNVVVRTWQPERDRRVVLVLDTSRTSAGRVGDVPAPRLGDGRRAAARRPRGPRRRPGRPRSPATARSGRGCARPAPATSPRACRRRWPTSSR